jgi:SAM-dependent methyltransferase
VPGLHRVNLGCGARFDPSWINIDMRATGEGVIAHDLSKGIPLPDASCEVVYHSHVLEHIPRDKAADFLKECYRVLAPGGILRVAVPDLERICRTYLEKLELALAGDKAAANDYDWIVLELYDQAVRNKSGGGMRDYIAAPELKNPDFILERIGEEGEGLIRALRATASDSAPAPRRSFFTRLRNVPNRLRQLYGRVVTRVVLGKKNAAALDAGLMRLSGEVHQWMYDRYSLGVLLESAGFQDARKMGAGESRISGWSSLNLDTNSSGQPVKPDSLYMEAVKPGTLNV